MKTAVVFRRPWWEDPLPVTATKHKLPKHAHKFHQGRNTLTRAVADETMGGRGGGGGGGTGGTILDSANTVECKHMRA